jgi:hypothetical protein
MKSFTFLKGAIALTICAACWCPEASAQCQFPNPIPFYSQNFGTGTRPVASPLTVDQVPELSYVGTGNMNAEKIYTITPTSNLHAPASDWHIVTDHTGNPNGRMMLVNDREPAGVTYRDRLHSSVLGQGNVYFFSAWIMNILTPGICTAGGNNPDIFISLRVDIKAGGVWTNLATSPIFTYPSPATSPAWNRIGVNFMTPNTVYDSARISINNESIVLCGNDYVLDDISVVGCVNNIILPVNLLSFSGSLRNNVTTLNWETSSEVSFSHYEIQRKDGTGGSFATIGDRLAGNNTGGRSAYQFNDNLAAANGDVFYYRLKMVDADAQFKYSKEVLVRKNQKAITGMVLSPSPVIVGGPANVRFESARSAIVTIRVVDLSGRTVLQQNSKASEGTNTVAINNLERLQTGSYVIQLSNGGELTALKFSVVR